MFREILYTVIGLAGRPEPFHYAPVEWVIALVGVALFLACGVFGIFTRIVFAINRSGGPARVAGWLTSVTLAFGWLGTTLELVGFLSILAFPIMVLLVLTGVGIYVAVTR